MFFRRLAAAVMAMFISAVPANALAQNLVEAGKTDCGILYIDTQSVNTVKKDGEFYLAVFAEEKYTDGNFLAALREGDDMQAAASAIYLYLFNTFGSEYCIGASYIIDTEGNVCADLGADMLPKDVAGNKALKNAYIMALKILESKNKQR